MAKGLGALYFNIGDIYPEYSLDTTRLDTVPDSDDKEVINTDTDEKQLVNVKKDKAKFYVAFIGIIVAALIMGVISKWI